MRVLIVANGELPSPQKLKRAVKDADYIIAADGAARIFAGLDLLPDVLIGDFDSADSADVDAMERKGVRIVKLPREKDATDTMAAIDLAKEKGATQGLLLGATGKRVDHLLANLTLLPYAKRMGMDLCIEDETCHISLKEGEARIKGKAGQTVSFFPMNGEARVYCPEGLKYPLSPLVINQENPVWVSNIMTQPEISLSIQGKILVMMIFE